MNMKRVRNRPQRPSGSGSRNLNGQIPLNRNHVFDSNGPEGRIRGTAQQLFEKYLQLGRDATSSGDRVTAEAFFQHAEHYFRIINAMAQAAQQAQMERQERANRHRASYASADMGEEQMAQPMDEAPSEEVIPQ
ncbi:MAG: DUF4167 domain-containing protein [Acetobacter sp.]|nr:DUF4167 domain-containing protein [Acetobacter sp.]MCH4061215.1 DUF4167 domain-containing protein [Acetobacter sp.]MCH4088152.1 DUF4167 domain-containing protein [Acetobacter sp.]MCI1294845.1 DUF4167 domain-containing protein [Acetobacter sp.]MCI1321491.1 DUF4167 domain-containing protein [Acetobacter sp.]